MNDDQPPIDRIEELLADHALQGLTDAEQAELARLSGDFEAEGLALELAAAEAALAFVAMDAVEALPDSLRSRLERDAGLFPGSPNPTRSVAGRVVPWLGWVAAAASLLFAVRSSRQPIPAPPPTLVERLSNASRLPLAATEHPLARGAEGQLVWSGDRQEGYLAIHGLAEVEAGRGIYQLWIFDESRDSRFPIDGGTFAINDARSTTLIPIRPCLSVRKPTLFAITLEPPEGVVVSDRKRILLTASVQP